jgi:hypothetical protein
MRIPDSGSVCGRTIAANEESFLVPVRLRRTNQWSVILLTTM